MSLNLVSVCGSEIMHLEISYIFLESVLCHTQMMGILYYHVEAKYYYWKHCRHTGLQWSAAKSVCHTCQYKIQFHSWSFWMLEHTQHHESSIISLLSYIIYCSSLIWSHSHTHINIYPKEQVIWHWQSTSVQSQYSPTL